MGILDVVMGRRKLAPPAPDRLFAISTAYVTIESRLELPSAGGAAIVFQPLSSADFRSIVNDTEEVVRATCADSRIELTTTDDSYGFRWLVLRGASFDDLVVGINAVSGSLESGGYGDRVLCAVFAFAAKTGGTAGSTGARVYWIYNYKRGSFYPFVPVGKGARDTEREFVLKAQIGSELPVEQDHDRWFPLWGIPI